MRNKIKAGLKRLSGEAGISLIEVLISVAILSLVALYVFQSFFAASTNIAAVERIDHAKMIAESLSDDIMARPDDFIAHMQWFKDNGNADFLPVAAGFEFYKKNAALKLEAPEQLNANTQVLNGTLTIDYTQKGQLCADKETDEVKMEAIVSFKQLKQTESVKLNAAQMASHTTTKYDLGKTNMRYTLVITDDEENKLKASNATGTQAGQFKLFTHMYKNKNFSEMSALADSKLSFLNEGVSPWLRLFSWLQLVENEHLNSFMQSVISIPTEETANVSQAVQSMRQNRYLSQTVLKHQLDESFGAVPILVEYDKYGGGEAFNLEVANLSSYHVDVLLKKKAEGALIETSVAEGSVNFIDLAKLSYKDFGMTVNIVIKEKDTDHILYRLGEHDGRYKIENQDN